MRVVDDLYAPDCEQTFTFSLSGSLRLFSGGNLSFKILFNCKMDTKGHTRCGEMGQRMIGRALKAGMRTTTIF